MHPWGSSCVITLSPSRAWTTSPGREFCLPFLAVFSFVIFLEGTNIRHSAVLIHESPDLRFRSGRSWRRARRGGGGVGGGADGVAHRSSDHEPRLGGANEL